MRVQDYLTNYSRKADVFFTSFFSTKKTFAKRIDSKIVDALRVFQVYSQGGKKVRGALTVLGYQACGGRNLKAILPVSCAVELFHSFLLIHDDIIDKDIKRRGKPTVHAIYSESGGEHYGNSKAIIIGDIGVFLAHELLLSSGFPKERITTAVAKLNEFLLMTGYGQLLDIDYDFKKDLSWDDILRVRTFKTAYYTVVMPLSIGAILAGANSKVLAAIEKYGKPIGIAYQLVDDILGVFGDTEKTGKSDVSDIREGKKTFLYVKSLELANKKDKKFLQKWYGRKNIEEVQVKKIREIIEFSGALSYSQNLAYQLVDKGKRNAKKITKTVKYQKILENLADFVVNREK